MFNDDQKEEYLKKQKEEEKQLRKVMREKGKYLKRAECAYDSLTDAEKIVINYYFNEENMSLGAAVIKSGLADSNEDAVRISKALENNKKFTEAIEELKSLAGITPMAIKQRIWDIANDKEVDASVRLKALNVIGDYSGLKQVNIKIESNTPIDVAEVKKRLVSMKRDALSSAVEYIAQLKAGESEVVEEPPAEDE